MIQTERGGARLCAPAVVSPEARQSISRVLYKTTIFLGWASPHSSSRLGGARKGTHCPGRALLPVRFTEPRKLPSALVRSYRTFPPLPAKCRRFLSVALSLGSPPAAVSSYRSLEEPGLSSEGFWPSAAVCLARFGVISIPYCRLARQFVQKFLAFTVMKRYNL